MVKGRNPCYFHPSDPTKPRPARKQNFRLSVFANHLPSMAKRQNRLLLITKKYYPLAGGSQQHQYPKQTDMRSLEAWCLVQLPCQIQAHRSSYSRSERERETGREVCYRACYSIIIPILYTFHDYKNDSMKKSFCCNSLL